MDLSKNWFFFDTERAQKVSSWLRAQKEHLCWIYNNLWGLGTESRNRVSLPARQATQPGGIGFLESIFGLLKSLKIRALAT